MGFLQRSKSAAVGEPEHRGKKDEAVAERHDESPIDGQPKERTSQERPKTADYRRSRSFSRPRTATGVSRTTERSFELDMPPPIEIKSGDETFSFPVPSPRFPPKSATYLPQPTLFGKTGSPQIGVALGSPGHPPMPSWGRSFTADHISPRMPEQPSRAPPAIPEQVTDDDHIVDKRKKASTWKSIFGRGRKSHKKIQEPFYSLKVAPHPDQPSDYLVAPGSTSRRFSPARSPVPPEFDVPTKHLQMQPMPMTRGMARLEARAEATLASFNQSDDLKRMRSPATVQKEGFSPMFRALSEHRASEDMFRAPEEVRNDSPLSMNEKFEEVKLLSPSTPRLDLDLPDPKFDRYSVMFEKFLEEPKLSLLERRQSKIQRTKSVKTLETISSVGEVAVPTIVEPPSVPQGNSTSSGIKKALSIRVSGAINRPRPIQRARTAPPGSQSPLAQGFAKAKAALCGLSPRSATFREGGLPTTPLTAATFSDVDSMAIINNDHDRLQNNLDQAEPAWNMLTSEATDLSPEKHLNPYRRVKTPEDLERNIVQVSVARQVSVSKARQQVRQSATSKQPLRPRVVELSKDKDRKSTVVLIENGDD